MTKNSNNDCCGDAENCPLSYSDCPASGNPSRRASLNYVLLPVEPNDAMLLDMSVQNAWEPDSDEGGCTERELAYEGYELLVKHGIPVSHDMLQGSDLVVSLPQTLSSHFSDKEGQVCPAALGFDVMDKDDWIKLAELRTLLGIEDAATPYAVLQFAILRIQRLKHALETPA